jgi:hypothetical protein
MANDLGDDAPASDLAALPRRQQWFDINDLSVMSGMSRKTLYRYIKDDKLPATKIGGKWYVTRQDFLRLFKIAITREGPSPHDNPDHEAPAGG